jgi:hypothetical protein
MKSTDLVDVSWNVEVSLIERGKRRRWHQRTHNIVVNTGRQFLAEAITPSDLGSPGDGVFTRTDNSVVRYVGFGIGGVGQAFSSAGAPPYSDNYPGTNVQTDDDVTVSVLERPVQTAPGVWMRQISAPGTFSAGGRNTRFIAVFAEADFNFGAFAAVPLSEIALYKSSANPALPSGAAGAYPGTGGHLVAYDTFTAIPKTQMFSIEVAWEFRF